MSDLFVRFADLTQLVDPIQGLAPLAVLLASLSGSFHCVSMCGGLMCSVSKSPTALMQYHVSRLTGYCLLGGAVALGGGAILQSPVFRFFPGLAAVLTGLTLALLGVQCWRGKSVHIFSSSSPWPKTVQRVVFRWVGQSPAGMGFFSALLPCGWLHGFLLTAATLRNPAQGVLLMFVFWLGTLPAMTFASWAMGQTMRQAFRSPGQRLSSLILIAAGIVTLAWKIVPWLRPLKVGCHSGHHLG